ncbi:MAG TPA: histidine triad nucleotide-binding protein [Anaeromyxobacteraceae bacterium]|nr:histidine triad nucleotide-binding protein [Anaeromyxobacteraceae bacterium]
MADCLFCKIVEGKIPAKIVHQDADSVAFEDINPQAPLHVLVVPRRHVPTMNDLHAEHDEVVGKLFRVAASIAKERGFSESGWRAVMNANADAGQTVFHVHLHVLGGRQFGWPPG